MGVKKNFGYNLVLTFCNYLFPLITYPYVSRVLGVENIGICNFVDSIINYFVLFSMLGIGSYGVREIARCKNNQEERNRVFSSLMSVNVVLTVFSLAVLIVLTYTISALAVYKQFLLIGVIKLLFNVILIEWLFQGIQEFKYITVRSIIVRLIYIILIFLFVHSEADTSIYYLLTALITVFNGLFNWIYSRRFVHLSFKNIRISPFIAPILAYGGYRILTSMYTSFNTAFLGFSSGDTEVGYFSTATKLYSILMGVFSAFTLAMIPKVAQMLKDNEIEKLKIIAKDTFSLLFAIAFPLIIFCEYQASTIINILSGAGYEGAIIPFQIVAILILVVGIEQIVIQQFLMATTNSNRGVLQLSITGALIGVLINICLTPKYGALGASIAWLISELAVLTTGLWLMNRNMGIRIPIKDFFSKLTYSSVYILVGYLIYLLDMHSIISLLLTGLCFLGLFIFQNLKLQPNKYMVEYYRLIKNRIK